jgi:hypothetical protein
MNKTEDLRKDLMHNAPIGHAAFSDTDKLEFVTEFDEPLFVSEYEIVNRRGGENVLSVKLEFDVYPEIPGFKGTREALEDISIR